MKAFRGKAQVYLSIMGGNMPLTGSIVSVVFKLDRIDLGAAKNQGFANQSLGSLFHPKAYQRYRNAACR